jgi:hypothetical protein
MIYGPKDDGTYDGDVLSISIPRTEAHVIRHFQERMPYGLSCRTLVSNKGGHSACTEQPSMVGGTE